LLYDFPMDDALFLKHVAAIAKDFPPRGHYIDHVEINGPQAQLHILPKTGFTGEPKVFAIAVIDDWDTVFRALASHRFFERLFDPVREIHP
jgi:hypothetical protein